VQDELTNDATGPRRLYAANMGDLDRMLGPQRLCRPDVLSVAAAGTLARHMARCRIGQAIDTDEPLATDYDLAGLLGLGDLRTFVPDEYRSGRPAAQRLRVPIGMSAAGVPIELDIEESAEGGMGPHGMMVGATGSGRASGSGTRVGGRPTYGRRRANPQCHPSGALPN
jgi:DNA segregation ATPase FtsK/SpoIIIE-like protein